MYCDKKEICIKYPFCLDSSCLDFEEKKELGIYKLISLITNIELREIVEKIFLKNIWQLKLPSSSTGLTHQHNLDEHKEWGQLLHIKKTVQTCLNATRRYGYFKQNEIDVIIACALLHDLPYKFAKIDDNIKFNKTHAIQNAEFLEKYFNNIEDAGLDAIFYNIPYIISMHMGIWNNYNNLFYYKPMNIIKYLNKKTHIFIKILQEGDYYSSRKDIGVEYNFELCKKLISQIKSD